MELELILTRLPPFQLGHSRQFVHGRIWSLCVYHDLLVYKNGHY